MFVGNSHVGDLHGVVVRTGPGSRGLSAFLVESTAPGLSLGRHQPAMGLHGFSFGELIFENCRVPAENLLGSEGDGLAVQTRYGKSLAELPTVKQKLGQMQSQLMTAKLAAYHAAHLLDEGLPCDAELISAKLLSVKSSSDSAGVFALSCPQLRSCR